jgi:chemotaxis protein MotA
MTPIGLGVAIVSILLSMILDHGQPTALINVPSMLLVFGGTIGVSVAGVDKKDLKVVRRAFMKAMKKAKISGGPAFVEHLTNAARDARGQGLLALETSLPEVKTDPFVRTGVELISLTSDPDRVRSVLAAEILGMRLRHRVGAGFFQQMGGFAPTIGILGTVIGLVRVLGNLSEPGKLGAAIASAFTATLWGVLSANVFWIPISNKLKRRTEEEARYKELVTEGLLALQEGLSGPQLRDRLDPFLVPADRAGATKGKKKADGAPTGPAREESAA